MASLTGELVETVKHGLLVHVDQALQKHGKGINRCNAVEVYPLHVAVWRNHLPILDRLIRAGASPDVADGESGWTPLHRALYLGHLSAAARLIQANASLDAHDYRGRAPVDLVSRELLPLAAAAPDKGRCIYSWGSGMNYQLGTGSMDFHETPVRVEALQGLGVVALAAAKFHSAAVTADGKLYTWGWGRGGRLGHPEFHIHSGETALIHPWQVVSVAAGKHHMLVATSAGELFSWGSNKDGKLGYAAVDTQPTPRKVDLKGRAAVVAAANKHSAVMTTGGEVFTFGANGEGQLGYGTPNSANNPSPRLVDALKGKVLVAVSAAKRHTVVLTLEGEAWTWGHKVVTPRKVNLTGVRDTARSTVAPLPGAAAMQPAAPALSAAATGGGGGSSSSSGQVAGELRFHRSHAEVVRPVAVAMAAGLAHTTVVTRSGSVLTWRSADPLLRAHEVLGALAGKQVVSLASNKTRTAVCTAEGDVYVWEAQHAAGDASGTTTSQAQQGPSGAPAATAGSSSSASGGPDGRSGSAAADASQQQQQQPILPVRVPGVKRASLVAVGEKHSMALQSWVLPPLPDKHGAMPHHPHRRRRGSSDTSGSDSEADVDGQRGALQASSSGRSPAAWGFGTGSGARSGPPPLPGSSPMGRSWGHDTSPQVSAGSAGGGSFRAGSLHSGSFSTAPPALGRGGTGQATAAPPPLDWAAIIGPPADPGRDGRGRGSDGDDDDLLEEGRMMAFGGSSPQGSPRSRPSSCIPSLQVLCQQAVATQVVEPRTALPILEYADVADAALLRCYCLAVALANLDCILAEAPSTLISLPSHLTAELEHLYRSALLGSGASGHSGAAGGGMRYSSSGLLQPLEAAADGLGSSYGPHAGAGGGVPSREGSGRALQGRGFPRAGSASGGLALLGTSPHSLSSSQLAGGGDAMSSLEAFHRQRTLVAKLQPGRRPTAAPAWLGGAPTSDLMSPRVGSRLAAAAQTALFAIGHAAAGSGFGSASSRHLEGHAAAGGALIAGSGGGSVLESEAGQKLVRTVQRKLQQIEGLEEQQRSGRHLDAQQHAKMGQRGALQDALAALAAGASVDQAQDMISHAGHVAAKLAGAAPAGAGGGAGPGASSQLAGQCQGASAAGAANSASVSCRDGNSSAVTAAAQQGLAPGRHSASKGSAAPDPTTHPIAAAAAAAAAASPGPGTGPQAAPQPGSFTPPPQAASRNTSEADNPVASGSTKPKQARRGALSMFLSGALDKPQPAPPSAAATASPQPAAADGAAPSASAAPKGPAWGGAAMVPPPAGGSSSLRELLNQLPAGGGGEPAAAAAGSAPSAAVTPGQNKGRPVGGSQQSRVEASARDPTAAAAAAVQGSPLPTASAAAAAAKVSLADFMVAKPAPIPTTAGPRKAAAGGGAAADKERDAVAGSSGPAWGGQGVLGSSPTGGGSVLSSTSLKDIQAEQQRQRVAAAAGWVRATSAATATAAAVPAVPAAGAASASSSSAVVLGSSPPVRQQYLGAAPGLAPQAAQQSKWYVPDLAQPQTVSKPLGAIQTEQKALKELAARYGGNAKASLVTGRQGGSAAAAAPVAAAAAAPPSTGGAAGQLGGPAPGAGASRHRQGRQGPAAGPRKGDRGTLPQAGSWGRVQVQPGSTTDRADKGGGGPSNEPKDLT